MLGKYRGFLVPREKVRKWDKPPKETKHAEKIDDVIEILGFNPYPD